MLREGLISAGFDTVLLETRHVKAALSAMTVKMDRRDARGNAQLLRMGWYRPVHVKTLPSQEVRAMLAARKALLKGVARLHKSILQIVRKDEICTRLMTIPGVGALTAITFRTAIDDPARITKPRDVGPLFGLTPRRYQSGETDVMGRISKAGDRMVRTALFEAAN
ncbi:MAG: IS110 family transposase, partial [Robiginitomaculum sp.]